MVKAKKWILAKAFAGDVDSSYFRLEDEDVPSPKTGEFLVQATFFSVDPYMRALPFPVGSTIIGEQTAKVIESKNKDYPVGSFVLLSSGWRSHTLVTDAMIKGDNPTDPSGLRLQKLPDMGKRPESLGLGVMGMPGITAYLCFLDICKPKAGEVVVVSAAAGAVGTIVGQIAKIKGCKVIGFAGSKDKCDWLKSLGFDYAFNYKTDDIAASVKRVAPDGVDCYYDNVGGDLTTAVIQNLKNYARVAVCGQISQYQNQNLKDRGDLVLQVLMKQLTFSGFLVFHQFARYNEARKQLLKWISEGKLKYEETVVNGFAKLPEALQSLFTSSNKGKVVVKA